MAFASSLQKGQIPVGCEICQGKNKIRFKCIDCELLMCSECMDRVHFRIAKDHQITDIKDIGKHVIFNEIKCENHTGQSCCLFCQTCKTFICPKCVAKVHNGHELIEEEDYNKGKVEIKPKQKSRIKLEIFKVYTTDLTDIHVITVCSNGSIWMSDATRSRLQHVKLRENRTEVKTSLNTEIYGMAKTHSNNILVTTKGTKLKLINTITGKMTDSMYDVKPLLPNSIHVTSDNRVIIGARTSSLGKQFSATDRGVVVVMDQEGKQLRDYGHDNQKKRLLTNPRFITSTSNGNICVVDWLDHGDRGRVVVFSPGGDILGIYTGHPDVKKKPFKPEGILTTPSDNIAVPDMNNHLLHILTDQGQSIAYYNLRDMEIIYPCSLALSTSGTIYIGCVSEKGSPDTFKSKLYELEYSGF